MPHGLLVAALSRGTTYEFGPFFAGGAGLLGACSRFSDTLLGDHELPRSLRVLFEERFLVFQLLLGRLHLTGGVGDARDDRMGARRRTVPRVCEQLPPVLLFRR